MSCRGLDLEGKYTLANQICQVIEEKCAWASCSDSTGSHCYGIDPTEEFRVGTEVVQREFSCSSDSYCAMFVDQYARSNVGDIGCCPDPGLIACCPAVLGYCICATNIAQCSAASSTQSSVPTSSPSSSQSSISSFATTTSIASSSSSSRSDSFTSSPTSQSSTSPPNATTGSTTASNTPATSASGSELSVGAKAGIALGSIAVAAAIVALILWLLIKAGILGKRTKPDTSPPSAHYNAAHPSPTNISEMQDSHLSELDGNPKFELVGGRVRERRI